MSLGGPKKRTANDGARHFTSWLDEGRKAENADSNSDDDCFLERWKKRGRSSEGRKREGKITFREPLNASLKLRAVFKQLMFKQAALARSLVRSLARRLMVPLRRSSHSLPGRTTHAHRIIPVIRGDKHKSDVVYSKERTLGCEIVVKKEYAYSRPSLWRIKRRKPLLN